MGLPLFDQLQELLILPDFGVCCGRGVLAETLNDAGSKANIHAHRLRELIHGLPVLVEAAQPVKLKPT